MRPQSSDQSTPTSGKKPAKSFLPDVLQEEIAHLQRRRDLLEVWAPDRGDAAVRNGDRQSADCEPPAERLQAAGDEYAQAHRIRPFAVALSGGGIRSATFNLGLLQALAERGLLPYVDYLSTVSGGGYIGSWLHGVIKRRGLAATAEALNPQDNPLPDAPDCDSISFLRKYSNYLAPQLGLFSSDLWVIGMIWVRNVLLNQLVLLPAIVAVFSVLLLAGFLQQTQLSGMWATWVPLIVMIAAVGIAGTLLARNLKAIVLQTFGTQVTETTKRGADKADRLIVPLMLVADVALACSDLRREPLAQVAACLMLLASFFALQVRGGFRKCYLGLHPEDRNPNLLSLLHVLWMAPLAAAFSIGMLLAYWHLWAGAASAWATLAYGPTLVAMCIGGGISLLIGLMGSDFPDAAREWTAATGATILIYCALWSGLMTIVVYGPWAIATLLATYGTVGWATIGAWVLMSLGGVLAGRSPQSTGTGDNQNSGRALQLLVSVAPTVFMLGYLTLIAAGIHLVLRALPAFQRHIQPVAQTSDWFFNHFGAYSTQYFQVLDVTNDPAGSWTNPNRFMTAIILALVSGLICVIASRRININEFSLHHFYKNRLVRAYLGASNNRARQPNALTGFDALDDFPISSLRIADPSGTSSSRYEGPFAIVNAALNLNTGSELAKQERKATSFVFTPLYSGFETNISRKDREAAREDAGLELHGYRETLGYGYTSGPSLGTAMAISGAAANPNSGYHTSGPMAFLLTVFDARLGWWLGNPRRLGPSRQPGPRFALWSLFSELFAQSNSRSHFVNLSDGGHFDNIGLYELVRRRCRYIIVGDSEEDGKMTFAALGDAIRRCRADFGVEIDIDPTPVQTKVNGFSQAHCVVGTIRYPEQEQDVYAGVCAGSRDAVEGDQARGWILYIKSSLTGDEPSDVIEYRSRCPQFPHQSTGDQFFSESQFESYRRLGLHIGRDAFDEVVKPSTGDHSDLLKFFQGLARKWYGPIPVSKETATRLANEYSALVRRIGEEERLGPVFGGLIGPQATPAQPPVVDDRAISFGLELIQHMQNVFTEYGFERGMNRANPRNAGWMGTFRRWAGPGPLYDAIWAQRSGDYNPLFQQFMTNLHEGIDDDVPRQP